MTPFILKQHEKDRMQLHDLEATEIDFVGGGDGISVLPTCTVTGTRRGDGSDGGDDGCDSNCAL